MTDQPTLRGFATLNIFAADMKAARDWYTELFGIEPYFQRPDAENPAYIEYRIGDYQHEFGIIDARYAPKAAQPGPGGAIALWHVDDIETMFEKLQSMGATAYDPITRREADFITASVVDPFGNILGIMYNPHYLKILDSMKKG
jgi:predicted enzyme related to lactoylglutathione lyase